MTSTLPETDRLTASQPSSQRATKPAPDKSGNRVNEFNMNISIKRAQAEDAAKTAPKAGAAK